MEQVDSMGGLPLAAEPEVKKSAGKKTGAKTAGAKIAPPPAATSTQDSVECTRCKKKFVPGSEKRKQCVHHYEDYAWNDEYWRTEWGCCESQEPDEPGCTVDWHSSDPNVAPAGEVTTEQADEGNGRRQYHRL